MDKRWLITTKSRILVGCLLVICLAQIALTTQTEFLDSDDWFLIHMGRTTAETPLSEWSHPLTRFWSEEPTWRPMSVILNTVEWHFFEKNAYARVAFHCALNAGCAFLVFLLVSYWFRSEKTGVWAAILFITHPIHAQSLGWFHAGFESIPITLAILATLWLFTKKKQTWIVLLSFQLALFVRENALCLPFLITAMMWARRSGTEKWHQTLRKSAPYWILLLINGALRIWMIHQEQSHQADLLQSFHVTADPLGALVTVLVQPWTPVLPSIEYASLWRWLFIGIAATTLFIQLRWKDRSYLKSCGLFFVLSALPFVLQIHDTLWSDQSLADDHDQRWYFYHLCVAGITAWIAAVLSNKPRWGTGVLAILTLIFFAAQIAHIQWWSAKGLLIRTVSATTDARPDQPIGIVTIQETSDSELVDQVFLTRSTRLNTTTDQTRTYKGTSIPIDSAFISHTTSREEIRWKNIETIPKEIQWWQWNPEKNELMQVHTK